MPVTSLKQIVAMFDKSFATIFFQDNKKNKKYKPESDERIKNAPLCVHFDKSNYLLQLCTH
jgi:hypothetical protein